MLAEHVGRREAHEPSQTRRAVRRTPGARPRRLLGDEAYAPVEADDRALDPAGYLGAADAFVERALTGTREAAMSAVLHHRLDGPDGAPVLVLVELARHDARDVGRAGPGAGRALPRAPLRPARPRRLAGPAGPYSIDELGRRRARRCSTRSGIERVALRGLLARRDDGHVARDQRARAGRAARALQHVGAASRAARDWRERAATVREQGIEADRRRRRSSAGSRRIGARRRAWRGLRAMLRATAARGLRGLLRGASRGMDLRDAARRRSSAPTLVIAGARRPGDPARPCAGDRRRHPGRAPRACSDGRATSPTSSSRTRSRELMRS